jgi:hypothetical protein
MVAGRNREIRALQQKMASNQGGNARQQQRMDYLQSQQGGIRSPERQAQRDNYLIRQSQREPQTGGPLMNAMGPGGQEAIRTQQPYQGGRMGIDGVTMEGGPFPMDGAYKQPGKDSQAALEMYQRMQQGGGQEAMSPMQGQPYGGANMQGLQQGQSMQDYMQQLQQQQPNLRNDPGFARPGVPPMQRPTPGNMPPGFTTYPLKMNESQIQDMMKRYPPGTQPPGLQNMPQFGPGAPVGNQGPDFFRGQGMDMGKFNKPGYQAPPRQVAGNQLAGGGTTMDRFSKPGYTAPPRQVQGNQLRGGGTSMGRFNRPVGILSKPPQN